MKQRPNALVAAVKLRPGVGHLEQRARPAQRPIKRPESVAVHARDLAGEGTRQIVTAPEQVELAPEIAGAGERPRLVLEENLAHPLKVHARVDVIAHLRPAAEIDLA